MFNNLIPELRYVASVSDSVGREFVLHTFESVMNEGPLAGCTCYELYLTDTNPEHDILVGIGRKAFFPDECESEEERLEILQRIFKDVVEKNADRAYELLNF